MGSESQEKLRTLLLTSVGQEDAEAVFEVYQQTFPASTRIHGNRDIDLLEVQLQLEEAKNDPARHAFLITDGSRKVGFVDMKIHNKDLWIGLFSTPLEPQAVRKAAWKLVEQRAGELGALEISVPLELEDRRSQNFFSAMGFETKEWKRSGWILMVRSTRGS